MELLSRFIAKASFSIKSDPVSDLNERLTSERCKGLVVITCSEFGNPPCIPRSSDLPVYIWQNLGNCIKDSAGLESLLMREQINDLIVYGHHPCSLIKVGINNKSVQNVSPSSIKIFKDRTVGMSSIIKQKYNGRIDNNVLKEASQIHILLQLKELLNLTVIQQLVKETKLQLHGWIFDSESEQLFCFDPEKRLFVPS